MRLKGKHVLITAAGQGIGKAIAERLAAEGACVVVADLNVENARAVAKNLGGSDVAVPVFIDVTDEQAIKEALAEAVRSFGGLDLVVNNAGLSISKLVEDFFARSPILGWTALAVASTIRVVSDGLDIRMPVSADVPRRAPIMRSNTAVTRALSAITPTTAARCRWSWPGRGWWRWWCCTPMRSPRPAMTSCWPRSVRTWHATSIPDAWCA